MNDATEAEWDDWIRDWRLHLSHATAASTISVYLRGLAQFRRWLDVAHGSVALGDVTKRHVEEWLGYLRAAGRSDSTRRVRLMTLRSFFGWVVSETDSPLPSSPADGIEAKMPDMPRVEIVDREHLTALLKVAGGKDFVDLRDNAIIRLLASTGLRRAELVSLDVEDYDRDANVLGVTGKGNKFRVVSLGGSKTPLALSRYLRARSKTAARSSPALFVATRQGASNGWRLTGGAIALILKRRCKQAGIPQIHPHQLRHTWAHSAKVAGLSDEDLERMAGWSSPMMVRRYGRAMAESRALDAHRNLAIGDDL